MNILWWNDHIYNYKMSKNLYKVTSSHKYYNYLSKYNPNFILQYQSGNNYFLGRR